MSIRLFLFSNLLGVLFNLSCGKKTIETFSNVSSTHVSITDFGAIPNDGKDDSYAIQRAIDYAISNDKSSKVYCPPGVYDLDDGIALVNMKHDKIRYITLTLSGHISSYDPNQNLGSTTVFNIKHKGFGVAIQKARNCVIENIVFRGNAGFSDKIDDIFKSQNSWNLKKNNEVNSDQYSPSCAIAIDPFYYQVPENSRYTNCKKYYKNNLRGGSSMILIRGCSFIENYIAISNNSSNGIQNGDNIRVEQSHVKRCHTFWAVGQSQSRANSIDNVYATFLHTFVHGSLIGAQNGTPPNISNLNLSGYSKKAFVLNTGFSSFNIYMSYMESVWTLGDINTTSVSFNQSVVKFHIPINHPSPQYHLYSNSTVAFRDCSILFFANCTYPAPIMFKSKGVLLSGGSVEGGVVVADGYTNAGGDDLHKVTYENVLIKCLGRVAGMKSTMKPTSKNDNSILMGGEHLINNNGDIILNNSTTYEVKYLGENYVDITENNAGSFVSNQTLNKGDNIFTSSVIENCSYSNFIDGSRLSLGFVSNSKGGRVSVYGIPCGLVSGKYHLYKISYPIYKKNNKVKYKIYKSE